MISSVPLAQVIRARGSSSCSPPGIVAHRSRRNRHSVAMHCIRVSMHLHIPRSRLIWLKDFGTSSTNSNLAQSLSWGRHGWCVVRRLTPLPFSYSFSYSFFSLLPPRSLLISNLVLVGQAHCKIGSVSRPLSPPPPLFFRKKKKRHTGVKYAGDVTPRCSSAGVCIGVWGGVFHSPHCRKHLCSGWY